VDLTLPVRCVGCADLFACALVDVLPIEEDDDLVRQEVSGMNNPRQSGFPRTAGSIGVRIPGELAGEQTCPQVTLVPVTGDAGPLA